MSSPARPDQTAPYGATPDDGRVVHRPTATFKPRRRALSDKRQSELENWLDRWGLDPTGPTIDWREEFGVTDTGTEVPVILDIGFGHGESTIALAREQPDQFVVGVEVHTPGVVTVLDAVEHDPLPHVRVVHGDVLRFLTRVTANSLTGVRVFFPDPWPKQKQHHRRLVRADVVGVLADRLQVGGVLHLATDIVHYAAAMQVACDAEARLSGGIVDRPTWRPLTRFEQRGLDEGHPAVDLIYTRTG